MRHRLTLRCLSGGGWPFVVGLLLDTVGQVVQILSIFVPLKVIYVVGAGEVPSYMAQHWPAGTLAQWAWSLTALAITLFVVSTTFSAIAGRLAGLASRRMVEGVAERNPDLGRKVLRALRSMVVSNFNLTSDLLICWLFVVLVFFIDSVFFGLILTILLVVLLVLGVTAGLSRKVIFFHQLWNRRYNSLVEGLMLILFVVFFVIMVAVILGGYELGFLRSLIILILARRLLQILERAIKRHRVVMRKQGVELLLV